MTYVIANAFDQYGSFSFGNGLRKGIITKVNSAGITLWSRHLNDYGKEGSVYSISLNSNAAPVIGRSVSYTFTDYLSRCVIGTLLSLWNANDRTPREISYVATLNTDGTLQNVYSFDQFTGTKLAKNSLVVDDNDQVVVGHSLALDSTPSEENPKILVVDGKVIRLTRKFNSFVSKISSNTFSPKLVWSTVVCEHSEGSGPCSIQSIHSSRSINHMIVVLSISGTVTIGGATQVTSEGSKPNLFVLVLSIT
ncbi:hypothetical protein FDP41_002336 [Naegleria fowleri]|uniref:Uncharacterized protein n=1 Tax=Naegleria fowleri TaxID=5763 RepID=A0A6A5BTI9_NAEFO|nr:uncharacterized protein FDP41_002336 [Naegleria fowleri]KAF0978516.1 hypothetical protein FDP41_002336 [Naegleria fowleri]